jgi:hypothetical protein
MHEPVINLEMNNEPLDDVQRQMRGLLARLPDAPVASNFTARVLQAIELEEKRRSRWRTMGWYWRVFVPRGAVAALLIGFAAFTFHEHELVVQQQDLARNAALVASQQMPSMDALNNFDAIQRMSQTAHPDDELLALASDLK